MKNKNTKNTKNNKKSKKKTNYRGNVLPSASIRTEMMKFQNELHPNASGLTFMDLIANPFNYPTYKVRGGYIPDGTAEDRLYFAFTTETNFSGGTASSCAIQIMPALYDVGAATHAVYGGIFYGNNALTGTESPTAFVALSNPTSYSIHDAIQAAFGVNLRYRPVCSGLRVRSVGPSDTASGTLYGALSLSSMITVAPSTYHAYNGITGGLREESHKMSEGITVRSRFSATDLEWKTVPTTMVATSDSPMIGKAAVIASGMSATTTLNIVSIHVFELAMPNGMMPFPTATQDLFEPELGQIVNLAERMDYVVSGNSFKGMGQKMINLAKNGYRVYQKNKSWIKPAVSALGLVV